MQTQEPELEKREASLWFCEITVGKGHSQSVDWKILGILSQPGHLTTRSPSGSWEDRSGSSIQSFLLFLIWTCSQQQFTQPILWVYKGIRMGWRGKTLSHEVGEKVKKETLHSYEQPSPEQRLTERLRYNHSIIGWFTLPASHSDITLLLSGTQGIGAEGVIAHSDLVCGRVRK